MSDRYTHIQQLAAEHPVTMLCDLLGVARSGYYDWRGRGPSPRQQEDARLVAPLEAAFIASRRTYGRVRLTRELKARGHACGQRRVRRLMRNQGLSVRPRRRFRPQTTESRHDQPSAPIQWVLLPQLASLQTRLPGVGLGVLNFATSEIASGLADGTIDLGLLRSDGVPAGAKSAPLGSLRFGLFVPARLLPGGKSAGLAARELARLPLATLEGEGVFRQELQRLSKWAKVVLDVRLEVSSFPLVARAVREGAFAGVLPDVARTEFAGAEVVEVKLDWLQPLNRPVALAWNPRLAGVRSALAKSIPVFTERCRIEGG